MAEDVFQNTGADQFESTEYDQWAAGTGTPGGSGYAQIGPLLITATIDGAAVSGHEIGNVNQRQTLGINISWTDLGGNEVTADGIFLIRDVQTGIDVRVKEGIYQQTMLPVFVYAHENEMRVMSKATEQRILLICLRYGANEQATARFEYSLVNLGFIAEDFE